MKEKIINYSKKINIDEIGFTNIQIVKDNMIIKKEVPFVNYDKTYDLINYDTIISIIMSYPHTCAKLENITKEEVYFSSSSWGQDYHIVLKNKLQELANYIENNVTDFKYEILVDNHPYDDRYIAYHAGLGFYGKNNLLINEKYGSYIFIGHLLTNLHLKANEEIKKQCYNCQKCINACPTKALNKKGYNYQKCLSYLTQKKELTKEEEQLLNNCIYGCDICTRVCPYNNKNNNSSHFTPSEIEFINVNKYKTLSNKEFKKIYGHLSGSWRGKKIIERNINIYKNKIN